MRTDVKMVNMVCVTLVSMLAILVPDFSRTVPRPAFPSLPPDGVTGLVDPQAFSGWHAAGDWLKSYLPVGNNQSPGNFICIIAKVSFLFKYSLPVRLHSISNSLTLFKWIQKFSSSMFETFKLRSYEQRKSGSARARKNIPNKDEAPRQSPSDRFNALQYTYSITHKFVVI